MPAWPERVQDQFHQWRERTPGYGNSDRGGDAAPNNVALSAVLPGFPVPDRSADGAGSAASGTQPGEAGMIARNGAVLAGYPT